MTGCSCNILLGLPRYESIYSIPLTRESRRILSPPAGGWVQFQRFEPSSRTFLIGEQPNPWDLIYLLSRVSASIRLFHHHIHDCYQSEHRCKPCDIAPSSTYLMVVPKNTTNQSLEEKSALIIVA